MRVRVASFVIALLVACGPGNSTRAPEGAVSVVDFNILHGVLNEDSRAEPFDLFPERLPRVAQVLGGRRPAVILLQETYFGWLTGYPDVRRILTAQLDAPGDPYQSVFASYLGAGVMFNGGAGIGQATLTRWPIVTASHLAIPGGRRIVIHVRVASGKEVLDTYNVHLDGERDAAAQSAEMKSVLAFIDRTAAADGSALVGGDFNSTDDEIASQVMREAGFVDLGAAAGLRCDDTEKRGCTNSNLPLGEPGQRASRRIDFLWLRSSTRLPSVTAPIFDTPFQLSQGASLWPSDHVGLAADF
jgi:endonuclease/exonuclease/phosphatase family metal-dependent hydrolase